MKQKYKLTRDYYYVCETCNTEFPTEQAAKQCEKKHKCTHWNYVCQYEQYYDEGASIVKECRECGYEEKISLQEMLDDNPALAEAIFNLLKKEKST